MNTTFRLSVLGAVLMALLVSACSSSPTGRKQLVLKSDAELARESARAFRLYQETGPLVTNGNTIDYVACVTDAIIAAVGDEADADIYWELAVLDNPSANAFVMPGGKIVVMSGILDMAENQDQLAAVLGHEVAHEIAHHGNERASRAAVAGVGIDIAAILLGGGYSNQTRGAYEALSAGASLGIMNPFSRKQETEADVVGLQYMARAGFDPRESVELWKNMNAKNTTKVPEYMSTHPSGETRIENLVSQYPTVLKMYNDAQAKGLRPECKKN